MAKFDYKRLLSNISIDEVAKRLGMDLRTETPTRFKALCPFHDDKTPSLLLDSDRTEGSQHYYCFACGAHGDAIDLVKGILQLGFKESIEWLSPGSTHSIDKRRHNRATNTTPSTISNRSGLEVGYSMYEAGKNIAELDLWIAQRRLDRKTVQRAGFVQASSNFLSRCLDAELDASARREFAGFLEDAYLIRKLSPATSETFHLPLNTSSVETRYSDFFIDDRVVFPLHDEKGQLVGLGARAIGELRGSRSPKYQFTRGFPKATVLYRAKHAFAQIQSEAKQGEKHLYLYLCEGFFDALRLEGLGLAAVAVMGSSISEQQIQLINGLRDSLAGKDLTLTLIVCFDRDEAGLRGAADTCLKLINSPSIECKFAFPMAAQLAYVGQSPHAKDPDEFLASLSKKAALDLIRNSTHSPLVAVLAFAFSSTAEDTLSNASWENSPRSRRLRAFAKASSQLQRVAGKETNSLIRDSAKPNASASNLQALNDWAIFSEETLAGSHRSLSEEYLNDAGARLNHSRILAYMGSKRGELPCNEPRWERLDIAATAFNSLFTEKLHSNNAEPIGSYDAVWVPRAFGGNEHRLKIMPLPEDLVMQQYLLNEILTERWDHKSFTGISFSRSIPAVRYYREERRTVTTGFDGKGNGVWNELNGRTLSFGYQIDMDVLEGRQPASDQGMYRPFNECWRDFMKSVSMQATEIGYVYSLRLDAKRYYDRLRRYVVRDSLLGRLQSAIGSVTDSTPGFAELLNFQETFKNAADKAVAVVDRLDEHLFGVTYNRPDNGLNEVTDTLMGIPQGPVLSAWIGTVALFPIDEVALRFFDTYNTDRTRVGYARYVDDIVLLADSPSILEEIRNAIDQCARSLELTLIAKAEEIPPMSSKDFTTYINQGRALAASGPAWEPPLIGDGESGWGFWSIPSTTDRQSALQLLHNVELYKASQDLLLKTVKTAFQATDLRTSELSKAARLIWYSIACNYSEDENTTEAITVWNMYLERWEDCLQSASWKLTPEKYIWESPYLFALEGLEHLLDTKARDVVELSADENFLRRKRVIWLAEFVLKEEFESWARTSDFGPKYQLDTRFKLIRWKALQVAGHHRETGSLPDAERSKLVQKWRPFEWMHEVVTLLSETKHNREDPLKPFVGRADELRRKGQMLGNEAKLFNALLPDDLRPLSANINENSPEDAVMSGIALQTLVSTLPKNQLLACLARRHKLLWREPHGVAQDRLVLPPLPGITISRLFSCLVSDTLVSGIVVAQGIQAIEIGANNLGLPTPIFHGSDGISEEVNRLIPKWTKRPVAGTNETVQMLDADLSTEEYFRLRERICVAENDLSKNELKQVAGLFRSIAQVVLSYAQDHEDKELVPAWPYIAASTDKKVHYLIGDGVSKAELGNRAFVRDGGRALRTVEVPIYEASLWRVGIAITDYLGLYDDVAKFSSMESDVVLDAAALASPARFILRSQLRKLRGAYANSQISRMQIEKHKLPSSIERSLLLLETFPDSEHRSVEQMIHVLTTESESAAMHLTFQEHWECIEIASFLKSLTNRVLARLPLSVAKELATDITKETGLRRNLTGILAFARRLFSTESETHVTTVTAWKALRTGTICTGISIAIDGIVASLRSHGAFERYRNFDFPIDWNIPADISSSDFSNTLKTDLNGGERVSLVEQLRCLIQHFGHRLNRGNDTLDRLSDASFEQLRLISQRLAEFEAHGNNSDLLLEWPFTAVSNHALDLLNLELLEQVAVTCKALDSELGLEVVLVEEYSYGFDAQTRRFIDSKNGVSDVTPWMISQFPFNARHIEEVCLNGRFLRIWSEVFDRNNGKLLSIALLGEPFASIAILKQPIISPELKELNTARQGEVATSPIVLKIDDPLVGSLSNIGEITPSPPFNPSKIEVIENRAPSNLNASTGNIPFPKEGESTRTESHNSNVAESSSTLGREANAFRKKQLDSWKSRGDKANKQDGHVRVALLQANMDLTYMHPLVETCPTNWPLSSNTKTVVNEHLKSDKIYSSLLKATEKSGSEFLWDGNSGKTEELPSWSEHRRQRILKRVIDSCEALNVDLLVLPEYSVRPETVVWIKSHIRNKNISVLAGTYMDFRHEPSLRSLTAQLALLWPVPKEVAKLLTTASQDDKHHNVENADFLSRGMVLEFLRGKKYRSIALNEFFRPSSLPLSPLFKPGDLFKALEDELKVKPSVEAISHLLSQTRLPLKHLLELICSEIFLVSSPANYLHMNADLKAMRVRFGEKRTVDSDEVFCDLKELTKFLSITGNGIEPRRSILAVPAATSRSADYWIAGQASFLAAGTTSIFCNSVGSKELVGGSCFIGRGSWKTEQGATGYISKITPYHGWSKGIFCNSSNDALSTEDQAVVVADIDPHNMLEGKPRPQTMPSPLQLVAYMPLAESVDWDRSEKNLLRILSVPDNDHPSGSLEKTKIRAHDEAIFWNTVREANTKHDEPSLKKLWGKFSDSAALFSRSKASQNNGDMQPTAPFGAHGLLATPAHYDWIDVSLTLTEQETLPLISVPPWKR